MAEIQFQPAASEEYREAYDWYQQRSQVTADRFDVEVARVLASVGSNPNLFPILDGECRSASLRKFPYLVVYRIVEDENSGHRDCPHPPIERSLA